jgi:hypothetical protein
MAPIQIEAAGLDVKRTPRVSPTVEGAVGDHQKASNIRRRFIVICFG